MAKVKSLKERLQGVFVEESRQPVCLEDATQFTCGGFETYPGIFMHF